MAQNRMFFVCFFFKNIDIFFIFPQKHIVDGHKNCLIEGCPNEYSQRMLKYISEHFSYQESGSKDKKLLYALEKDFPPESKDLTCIALDKQVFIFFFYFIFFYIF